MGLRASIQQPAEVRDEGFLASNGASSPAGRPSSPASEAVTEQVDGREVAAWLTELPRDCIVRVLSFLRPTDACRVARVCRMLRAIVDCDEVWIPRLPSDPAINPRCLSKKDLYFRLRSFMLRKDFSQPFWLDPATGEGCFVKPARDLKIEWGDDPRHWVWKEQPDSWFPDSACLVGTCWFEVRGEFEGVFLPGAYTVSFRLRFADGLSGWERSPIKLFLSTSTGQQNVQSQRLLSGNQIPPPSSSKVAPLRSRAACLWWMELDVGEFVVEQEKHVKLQFSMLEIEGGDRKQGLILDCVKVQPSSALSKDLYI